MEILTPDSPQMAIAHDLLTQYPFATLMVAKATEPMPEIGHLPFLFDQSNHCLYAHAAANNPLIKLVESGQTQATVVFTGEHGYVSPTWTAHQKVPTWDYCVIHVVGHIELVEIPEQKYQSMVEQVSAMEPQWQISELNDKLQTQMLKAIKVIKINVTSISGRYKMSQNKHPDGKNAILAHFTTRGNDALVARYRALF